MSHYCVIFFIQTTVSLLCPTLCIQNIRDRNADFYPHRSSVVQNTKQGVSVQGQHREGRPLASCHSASVSTQGPPPAPCDCRILGSLSKPAQCRHADTGAVPVLGAAELPSAPVRRQPLRRAGPLHRSHSRCHGSSGPHVHVISKKPTGPNCTPCPRVPRTSAPVTYHAIP